MGNENLQNLGGSKELSAGSTARRFEPVGGLKKHNERIHRESACADSNLNLPFSFSKPKKSGRTEVKKCSGCGELVLVPVNTVGIICRECGKFEKVE